MEKAGLLFWLVSRQDGDPNTKVICTARNREEAKRKARLHLYGDKEQYVVTPLTKEGDTVWLDFHPFRLRM